MNSEPSAVTTEPTAAHPFKVPDFRLLWIGSTISLFGDQFYFVALPWLTLELTGSGLALGTILMAAAIPRAVFMLLGGAISDRFSPRRILILTASARTALVTAVALLISLHVLRLWHLYLLAVAFGFADAFSYPAGQALLPALVSQEQLQAANALMNTSYQLSSVAGPAPAGIIVKRWGTVAAFWIDAVSFLFVIAALFRIPETPRVPEARKPSNGMGHAILEGLHCVARDPQMRSLMLLAAALNFGVVGPIVVGLATISKVRFASATAFGSLLSALAVGSLIGAVLPAVMKRQRHRGAMLLILSGIIGIAMAMLGLMQSIGPMAATLGAMGVGSGLMTVHVQAWFQERVERALLGRVLSVLMFAAVGLIPFSYALAGALTQINLTLMFLLSGALVLGTTALAALNPSVRAID